ncbi:DeoR/GlpR transcriptional regulator [Paenibacillus sp. F411]|uniref:Transcriptional regulator, DeoR family n=1 Tax=Paenibacillus algicola TaxID=2565926 RepID=A0A4P8XIH7_9BACL|nr:MULTISPECIES: DeoR/GlpR family DNA-binding transcription regulator [Paenibacillus]MBO2945003.1 DeoR/GlpR transcriptional regulator [Paenibacillus sp. F411]QCT02396.1 transcriptional regulator, DeoR family [Paenibacillus algicola]
MLTEERYRIIIQRLQESGVVKLQELVTLLEASESTIRRDLVDLEERGLLKRIHGGASLPGHKLPEQGLEEKSSRNIHEKSKIASLAAMQVKDGEYIYIDAGTTTLAMIPLISARGVTVVTNGLSHIEALADQQIDSYLLGGKMKTRTRAVIGSIALQNMEHFRFDRCFLGTNGADVQMGYTTPDPEEALIKRRAHQLSSASYVLADASKFGEVSFAKVLEVQEAALITDRMPEAWRESFANKTKIIEGSQ